MDTCFAGAGIVFWSTHYKGNILPRGWWLGIIGAMIGITGVYLVRTNWLKAARASNNSYIKRKQQLSQYKDKIKVPLADCEIKSNTYTEESYELPEIERIPYDPDPVRNDDYRPFGDNRRISNKGITVLQYTTEYNGQSCVFRSAPIDKEPDYVKFAILAAGHTFIYLDPSNPRDYFFDTSFAEGGA